ncbi:MAG: hypothetical protein VCG02_19215 [Verrucomicrobiota bacterium]
MISCLRFPCFRAVIATASAFFFVFPAASLHAQQPPPLISHTPVKVSPRGKPLNIIAQIDGRGKEVASATLHFRRGVNAAPIDVPMEKTTVGTWYGTIPSSYLANKGIIQYYIDAANSAGEWTETVYYTISVIDPKAPGSTPLPGPSGQQPVELGKDRSWLWPTVLIGGGALAVAGAVALADGGNNSSDGNDGGGTETPITDRVITVSASGRDELAFPHVTTIDASDEVGENTIEQVRIELKVNAVDGFEERFQVVYEGTTVIDTGLVPGEDVRTTGTLSGTSPLVEVWVVSSRADDTGANNYTWTATATFFLAE